ncbi:hypothetical protein MYAM1_003884 [Malassezia yamatoensis]|uniref:Uncharacterized protein n=1 Tax=Malassezia yamatoensis TaxID=253288 RepID=A0AAJ5Z0T0_9BASI|nr:hypothetical protein MYAM1_003884 [Malassezia yamatoensis]
MVLMILTNIGQLTTNIVARNIDIVHMKISEPTNILGSSSGLASKIQIPQEVKWGLYRLAFLITCLIHMSALVIAGMLALISFALLVAGAAIWTYIIHEFKKISSSPYMFDYGDSLWFTWAAVGCLLFALPTLLSGSIASRRRYYEEPYY